MIQTRKMSPIRYTSDPECTGQCEAVLSVCLIHLQKAFLNYVTLERERDRQTDRKTETERKREKERESVRERERKMREREIHQLTDKQTDRQTLFLMSH